MKWLSILLLVLILPVLSAQSQRDSARKITSRPEYRDYRIERSEADRRKYDNQNGRDGSGNGGKSTAPDSGSRRGAQGRETAPQRSSGDSNYDFGGGSEAVGAIAQVFMYIMWGAFGIGVLIALYFIIKALVQMDWKRKRKTKATKATEAKATIEESDQPDVPEELAPIFHDALELALMEYEKALASQDWARATLLSYRIFWLKAGWRGCIEEEDVRTWRDAIRMVAAQEHRQTVKTLLRLVEYVRYGQHTPSEPEFRKWLQHLQTLPTRGVLV
ncbi:hypothetical protein OAU50_06525 [Planctomycetota bacterium]|nr:hypothetical protein [Planctomycetota bacterium]